jgi:hypothetical protein
MTPPGAFSRSTAPAGTRVVDQSAAAQSSYEPKHGATWV